MSDFAYKRAKREADAEPLVVAVDDGTDNGVRLTLKPRLGTQALEAIARTHNEDPNGMFDFLRAQMTGDSFKAFLSLDLDIEDELPRFVEGLIALYGDPGKSDGSPTSSSNDGASSNPISSASTESTPKVGSPVG
jgi:hypothetical protein